MKVGQRKILKLFFYSLIFILHANLFSANPANYSYTYIFGDSISAYKFYQKSVVFLNNEELDSARYYAERSLYIADEFDFLKLEIDNLLNLAYIHKRFGENQFTNKYLLTAENKLIRAGDNDRLFEVYNQIGDIFSEQGNYNKAIENYQKADDISLSVKKYNSLAKLYKNYAFALSESGNDDLAIAKYNRELSLHKAFNNIDNQITTLHNIVRVYLKINKNEEAIQKYTDIFELYTEKNDFQGMSNSLNNIGYTYFLINDYEKALQAFKGALNIDYQSKISDDRKAIVLQNIGICYQNLDEFRKALNSLIEAKKIFEKNKNNSKVAEIENLIALMHLKESDLYNASIYSENSILTAKRADNPEILKVCYETYSKILQERNEFQEALEYYQKYLNIRDSLLVEQKIKEQEQFQLQYITEKTEKEIKLLLVDQEIKDLAMQQLKLETEKKEQEVQLLKKEKELQESNLKQQELEKQKAIQNLVLEKQKYEADVKEKEIIALQNEKDLQQAILKQKELEKKEQQKTITLLEKDSEIKQLALDKQHEQKRKRQWTGVFFTIVFILVTIGLIITKKKNHKLALQKEQIEETNIDLKQKNEEVITQKEHLEVANKEINQKNVILEQKSEEILTQNEELNQKNEEISQQKEVIELKNQDITDSIHYARRIQNAVLPPVEEINNILQDYFILFRPRDIVSGDFYWLQEYEGKIIVVAADCTGHGVPGAFMSMLSVSLLNEIVNTRPFNNAADILNILRGEVKLSLRQTGKKGEAKDGLDCALCIIDKEEGTMQYAGANNPLYLVRNKEIHYYKADRMPIGIYVRSEDSFTNNEIKIYKDDSIYIASDGYPDQFGGELGKKFLTKNFKLLLLDINEHPMQVQKLIMEKRLKDWMGIKHDQIDDILVMGMKI